MTTGKSGDSLNLDWKQLSERAADIYYFFEHHKELFLKIFTFNSFEEYELMQEYAHYIEKNIERIYCDDLPTAQKNHAKEIKDLEEQVKDLTKEKESLEDEVKELKNEVKCLESECESWETRYEEKGE